MFRNNDPDDNGGFLELIGYDGFTQVFTAQSLGLSPGIHTIKLVISDVGDMSHDSAVFVRAGSFVGQQVQENIRFVPVEKGDLNHFRDQGYTIVENNVVQHSREWGVLFDAGTRDGAGANLAHPGSPMPLREINMQRLVPGITIQNNLLAFNGGIEASRPGGGVLFSGDNAAGPAAAVPFGRIVNNTIYGLGTGNPTGIRVEQNASPTILNNILARLPTGIAVDGTSTSTEINASIYQNVTSPVVGDTDGAYSLILAPSEPLFVNPAGGNFYLAPGSKAIDNSMESLNERLSMKTVRQPLGIDDSPIKAPTYDLFGQLRYDDPIYSPPTGPGAGGNVAVDRGALERVDLQAPTADLIHPLDNNPQQTSRLTMCTWWTRRWPIFRSS
jgi:hypothetical protein